MLRSLPQNEVTVMVLNEIAVHFGRGFFYYLPSRAAWRTLSKGGDRLPESKSSLAPGQVYRND